MDVASILLVLAAAGQVGWSSDRYEAPPAASAPSHDRYAMPQASQPTGTGVAPPPGVMDRARTAVNETGTAFREGVEAGIQAANQQFSRSGSEFVDVTRNATQDAGQQIQGWANNAGSDLQQAGNSFSASAQQTINSSTRGKVSNPFAPAPTTPAPTAKTRGGVAPPPWAAAAEADPSESSAPLWHGEASTFDAPFQRIAATPTSPRKTESGWTSIGNDVAAPPMSMPQLTNAPVETSRLTAVSQGPVFPTVSQGSQPAQSVTAGHAESATSGADSWATGWGTNAQAPSIGRDATAASPVGISRNEHSLIAQPANAATPAAQQAGGAQQAAGDWPDLWAKDAAWPQQQPPAVTAKTPAQPTSATPAAIAGNPTMPSQPAAGSGQNAVTSNVILPSGPPAVSQNAAKPVTTANQPPWMPLLLVSLSLAGSLGANLFLGFSYLDARQKYRSLVRKTADKFRRSAA